MQRLALVILTLPFWAGCDGCRRPGTNPPANEKKATAVTQEFTIGAASPLPGGGSLASSGIKPGHWFSLRQSIRSNERDQRGDLTFGVHIVDPNLPATTRLEDLAGLTCKRPAVLPKGRMKRLDVRLLAPLHGSEINQKAVTISRYNSDTSLTEDARVNHNLLASSEFFFVVLTTRPQRFTAFQSADWIRPPQIADDSFRGANHFRMVFPRDGGLLALPETMLDWTNTAYVFWDDLSPSELTPEQMRALEDWVQFGGRLIVNGTASVDQLAGTSLGKQLPIQFDRMIGLDTAAAQSLVERWSVAGDDTTQQLATSLAVQETRVAVGGELADSAIYIENTGDLLAARRAGRGEIVMSRFDLTSDWMNRWRSRDSFFNAVALARPARQFELVGDRLIETYVQATTRPLADTIGTPSSLAMMNSTLRLSSRDARLDFAAVPSLGNASSATTAENSQNEQREQREQSVADTDSSGTAASGIAAGSTETEALLPALANARDFNAHPNSGMSGWRDDSDVGRLLQAKLRTLSGVNIPSRSFVLQTLALYLTILIPLNYLFFRVLGRLEWGWLSVPLVAILGAGYIARTVSLDLGLARNQSEVALLELQGGYSRGHLTRYSAIYNSLSTNYTIQFDQPDVAIAPLESNGEFGASTCTIQYGYSAGPALTGFAVPSNRTRMVHTEQIVDAGGSLQWSGDQLANRTQLALVNVRLSRSTNTGEPQSAFLDRLDPGSTRRIQWQNAGNEDAADQTPGLITTNSLPPGDVRLVAEIEGVFQALQIEPAVPLQNQTTLVLAHLQHAPIRRQSGDPKLLPSLRERQELLLDSSLDLDPAEAKEIPLR